jgi:hypothetical protein
MPSPEPPALETPPPAFNRMVLPSPAGEPAIYRDPAKAPPTHLSVSAFIAAGVFLAALMVLPPLGAIPAVVSYALARAALSKSDGPPLHPFSRILAITVRVASMLLLVLEMLVAFVFLFLLFAEYNEFIQQWHDMISLGGGILGFVKFVFHYFFGHH